MQKTIINNSKNNLKYAFPPAVYENSFSPTTSPINLIKNKSNKNFKNICINKNVLYEILEYANLSYGDRNQINSCL